MIHRIIETIRNSNGPSKFEKYFINIQRDGRFGHPSVAEARKDYAVSIGFEGHPFG